MPIIFATIHTMHGGVAYTRKKGEKLPELDRKRRNYHRTAKNRSTVVKLVEDYYLPGQPLAETHLLGRTFIGYSRYVCARYQTERQPQDVDGLGGFD